MFDRSFNLSQAASVLVNLLSDVCEYIDGFLTCPLLNNAAELPIILEIIADNIIC